MIIRKEDKVIITSGKDKGKVGKVLRAFPKEGLILVDGVNMKKKHARARKSGKKGEIVDIAHPISVSNALIYDEETKKGSRIGKKMIGDAFVRVNKKTGKEI